MSPVSPRTTTPASPVGKWQSLTQTLPLLASGGVPTVPRRLGHRRQAAGRVRHQLQINKRRLDAGVSQPPAEVIQGYPVQQQVTGVAVPQRVSADVQAAVQLARINRPLCRQMDSPPGRRP